MKHRSLRRHEGHAVTLTLDNATGVRGLLQRAYRDHLLIADAQGLAQNAEGETIAENKSGAVDAVPLRRVLRIRLERE